MTIRHLIREFFAFVFASALLALIGWTVYQVIAVVSS